MQYLLLLHGDESNDVDLTEEQMTKLYAEYGAYNKQLIDAGVMRGGAALHPSHTATTLRDRDGSIHLTDGPFLETREQLGGYYVIEVDHLDDAIAWAKKCPAMKGGTIEIRALAETPDDL